MRGDGSIPRGKLQEDMPEPYRTRVAIFSFALNAAFLYFVWIFVSTLFRFGPSGIEYANPQDVTAWVLLPIFVLSTIFLLVNTVYLFLARRSAEVRPWPILALNVVQIVLSVAIIAFILNVLLCASPVVLGFRVC